MVGGVLTDIQVTNASTNSYEGQAIDTNTASGTYDYVEGGRYYRAFNDSGGNSSYNPDGDYYKRVTGGTVNGSGWNVSGEPNRYNGFVAPTVSCPQFDGGFQFTSFAQFDNGANVVSTADIASSLFGTSNITTSGSQVVGLTRTAGTAAERPSEYFDFTLQNDQAHFAARTTELTSGNAIDLSDASIVVTDGNANQGLGLVYKEVGSISDLPTSCKNGLKIKIRGDIESAADDYYVQFETNDAGAFGEGSWVETNGFGVTTSIDNTTMPYELINTSLNRFDLSPMAFGRRTVGDDSSNPMPSFVGKTINNIFLYKNRLGFLLEDTVVFSEAGLGVVVDGSVEYNFFRTTTTTTLDSDPIDVTLSSGKVTNLQHAVGFQENLILFSTNGQFALQSSDLLTADSVSINPITNFEHSTSVAPAAVGSYIYFPFNRGSYTGIREFTVNSTTDNYDAQEITEHVPTYVPNDLNTLVGNSSEDILIGFAPSTPKTLYIYKYFWSGTKKLLSSWSKFTFPFEVRGVDILEGTAYIIAVKEGKTHLLTMPLQSGIKDTGTNYTTYLDMRTKHTPTAVSINGTFEQSGDGWQQNFSGAQQGLSFTSKGAEIDTDLHQGNGVVYLQRNSVMTIGTTYKLTYTITEATNADIRLQNGAGSNNAPDQVFYLQNTVGTHTQYFTKVTNSALIIRAHAGQVTFSELKLEEATTSVPLNFIASTDDKVQVWSDEGTLLKEHIAVGNETSLTLSSPKAGWFVGIGYKMKYTFSEQVFKNAAGNSQAPSNFVKAQIRNGVVFFNDTAGFTISVTPDKRDASNHTYSNPYTSFIVGVDQIGKLNLESNSFRFPVFTDAFDTVITIENDSALPANFSSAEFEMFVHERSRRFG